MPAKVVPFGKNWLHFDGCHVRQRIQLSLVCTVSLLLLGIVPARAQPNPTIERLLIDGWEVAGYVAVAGNRSLILFGHKVHRHLVQCSVLIDVTRNPQIVTACYELK